MNFSEIEKSLVQSLNKQMAESLSVENLAERFKIVNRIRKGKVQRRKKVSSREGFTMRDGKFKKMSAAERRTRSISQKKASKKRKAKSATTNRNRRISLRKRERLVR